MMGKKVGKVIKVLKKEDKKTEVLVKIEDKEYKAINYNNLTGQINENHEVLLNTTAVELSLGTGGYHFVIANLNHPTKKLSEGGHMMKLRYTPYQLKVFSAEEQESPYHHMFNEFSSLEGMPVIVGTLHSMLIPIVETLRSFKKDLKIAYIMTDAAALPIDFSNTVKELKEKKWIHQTITIGHAFGGDLECINIYNGLIAANKISKCDVCIVTMGPGIAGTGTEFGFSGVEQGNIIDAVNILGGKAIAVARMSFHDARKRHEGISHHTLTVLDKISQTKAYVALPKLSEQKDLKIHDQIQSLKLHKKHEIEYMDKSYVKEVLEHSSMNMKTMGRSFIQDEEFFITAGLSAQMAIKFLSDHQ